MTKPVQYVFVLWGKGFYEASATIFVTELRRAGLRVKVVGLTQRRTSGAFGLALVPDVTLDQILLAASHARGVGAAELDEALMSAHPLTVLVDDLLERVAPPDMEQLMRRALGVEVS